MKQTVIFAVIVILVITKDAWAQMKNAAVPAKQAGIANQTKTLDGKINIPLNAIYKVERRNLQKFATPTVKLTQIMKS